MRVRRVVMTCLRDARASCARHIALRQRARLLDAVWHEARNGSLLHAILPRGLLSDLSRGPGQLDEYTVDLGFSPDGVERVARDRVGPHPGAPLLEAPMLAVFLPRLCRVLLGRSLLLASMPVWWLGDRETLSMLAAAPWRFCLRDGLDPELAPIPLATLSADQRRQLQQKVDRAPQRYVTTLTCEMTTVRHNCKL